MNKQYPNEFSKQEIIEEINTSYLKLNSSALSEGEKKQLLIYIELGQHQIQILNGELSHLQLQNILNNNQKTSNSNLFLSILMLIFTGLGIYSSIYNNCSSEQNKLIQSLREIINSNTKSLLYHMEQADSINHTIIKKNYEGKK